MRNLEWLHDGQVSSNMTSLYFEVSKWRKKYKDSFGYWLENITFIYMTTFRFIGCISFFQSSKTYIEMAISLISSCRSNKFCNLAICSKTISLCFVLLNSRQSRRTCNALKVSSEIDIFFLLKNTSKVFDVSFKFDLLVTEVSNRMRFVQKLLQLVRIFSFKRA